MALASAVSGIRRKERTVLMLPTMANVAARIGNQRSHSGSGAEPELGGGSGSPFRTRLGVSGEGSGRAASRKKTKKMGSRSKMNQVLMITRGVIRYMSSQTQA